MILDWIVLGFILVIAAGNGKTVMDLSSEGWFPIKWDWWNKLASYDNKNHMVRPIRPDDSWFTKSWLNFWRWMFRNPLVFLTDGWHLAQFIFLNSLGGSGSSFLAAFNSPEWWIPIATVNTMKFVFWVAYKIWKWRK